MRIIINADDFGKSDSVNRAIVFCFQEGLITNTTVMVNMPAFDDAVKLSKEKNFFDKVGLHLNFFAGVPLTEEMKGDKILCKNGVMTSENYFHKLGTIKRIFLNKQTKRNIRIECEAQVKKFIEAGFTLRHFDSHGHSHTLISFWRIIKRVLKKYGFETTRISENVSKKKRLISRCYKFIFNTFKTKSFRRPDYLCSYKDIDKSLFSKNRILEIMVHPDYENGVLVNRYGKVYTEYPTKDNVISNLLTNFNSL